MVVEGTATEETTQKVNKTQMTHGDDATKRATKHPTTQILHTNISNGILNDSWSIGAIPTGTIQIVTIQIG